MDFFRRIIGGASTPHANQRQRATQRATPRQRVASHLTQRATPSVVVAPTQRHRVIASPPTIQDLLVASKLLPEIYDALKSLSDPDAVSLKFSQLQSQYLRRDWLGGKFFEYSVKAITNMMDKADQEGHVFSTDSLYKMFAFLTDLLYDNRKNQISGRCYANGVILDLASKIKNADSQGNYLGKMSDAFKKILPEFDGKEMKIIFENNFIIVKKTDTIQSWRHKCSRLPEHTLTLNSRNDVSANRMVNQRIRKEARGSVYPPQDRVSSRKPTLSERMISRKVAYFDECIKPLIEPYIQTTAERGGGRQQRTTAAQGGGGHPLLRMTRSIVHQRPTPQSKG